MDLSNLTNEEIKELCLEKKIGAKELTDNGICPTCFNREYDGCVFGDDTDKTIYEDEDFTCFLVGNPRCEGHAVISTKIHYKDMMEIPDEIAAKINILSKHIMNVIRETYKSESVYLCTMCDGPMNHFYVQLIPRYSYEKRGSKNFVKERIEYKEDKEKIKILRNKLNYKTE